jgi:hypothetical protein
VSDMPGNSLVGHIAHAGRRPGMAPQGMGTGRVNGYPWVKNTRAYNVSSYSKKYEIR